ncbi:type III-B CRISPR-associated protein Cas10/Cmr2 [Roseofilum sp. BLCC_M91]|uniref:Type III-B CRISPR-associated protein Cas10/Cmr2 n=1 Tax=Roseofilum halophilum BLCC-M91 TaxID=3022259 RepID=A0ABT7BJE3_9CYAN|nr:type III-B CRISPR-associated protein Cas10/Cmr2 [Roseofilum halophilum]MDJ1178626.1 type III-B CRISPR-associated protein Cas10/Cmr2 [Roseofilum halophilum BLCC-M91]
MNPEIWLREQQNLYPDDSLSLERPELCIHPVSGTLANTQFLKSQFPWGGGASCESCVQIRHLPSDLNLNQIGVLTFGPVQSFLGGGQRLRDWAVGSWLCHYLSAVIIYEWQRQGGRVLLPLHKEQALVQWLENKPLNSEKFWQPELPNVITGLYPAQDDWLTNLSRSVDAHWRCLVETLEQVVIQHRVYGRLINGQGWRVIQNDHQYLWSVYQDSCRLNQDSASKDIENLHKIIDAQKIGRRWTKSWWGGRTSPSDGQLSIWHPGLRLVYLEGTSGLPDNQLREFWENLANQEQGEFARLFSKSDRLNSIELVKRLASIPEIIAPTLQKLWGKNPPPCPWGTFPDRTAIAATWVTQYPQLEPQWNEALEALEESVLFPEAMKKTKWGIKSADRPEVNFHHPQILERRAIEDKEKQALWDEQPPLRWQSAIQWTVGWRGDGDNIGKWLSGEQYQTERLPWLNWHPVLKTIPENPPRKTELPHMLDLCVLFRYWNELLYPLTEDSHQGKVIFAGGDDFLLLGPLTEFIPLTTDLYHLWNGTGSIEGLVDNTDTEDGWLKYGDENQLYPVPGERMHFSLGVVVAQRRVPQSLWDRNLNEAYKIAKKQGRNRVCIRVLFNSGQSLDWVCPWPLWERLMNFSPQTTREATELNRWEKLLLDLERIRLRQKSIYALRHPLNTLWKSLGIPLNFNQVYEGNRNFRRELEDWQWWINWVSLRAFLARQERDREKVISINN